MSLEILTGFDGSCPHSRRGVKRDRKGHFTLYPWVRKTKGINEEVAGCGSRLSTRIRNKGSRTLKTVLTVDWSTDKRTGGHDLGYIRREGEDEWTMIPGVRSGSIVKYHLEVPAGVMELGLYPEYNCSMCRQYVKRLESLGVEVEKIGKSRQKREIWQISFPSKNRKAGNFFIQARDHAYETAGSYCVEGVTDFLVSGLPLANYLRSKFNIYIVPMTNPDGVYNGMSRLTWERGADMHGSHAQRDAAHETLKRAVDKVRPLVHMNIHSWTHKFVDGLLANEQNILEHILEHMPADHAHYKRWHLQTPTAWLKAREKRINHEARKNWKDYVREEFNAIGVIFEFPWFMRNTADMREMGRRAFIALALAVIEEESL